jgi:glycosyltransferase involved in cell wall biosynthesis
MSDQPLVSVIVIAYRQEKFIREAVQSAFAQTYENLEIILSDDASPDRTFDIMTEEANRYQGRHKVILNRNPENLGLSGNLSRAAQIASGGLLIVQDGDDISLPMRTAKLVERWVGDRPQPDLVFSDVIRIGSDGNVLQRQVPPLPLATLEEVAGGKFFLAGGCVAAYSRKLFEKYGPLSPAVKYNDYVLTFRALLGGGCAFINEPLVRYRVHADSIIQSTRASERTRRVAARYAKNAVAEAEDRLRSWDLSGRTNRLLRWRLARNLAYARLNARSSAGSRFAALGCVIWALLTGRPNGALRFFRRDVLNQQLF